VLANLNLVESKSEPVTADLTKTHPFTHSTANMLMTYAYIHIS